MELQKGLSTSGAAGGQPISIVNISLAGEGGVASEDTSWRLLSLDYTSSPDSRSSTGASSVAAADVVPWLQLVRTSGSAAEGVQLLLSAADLPEVGPTEPHRASLVVEVTSLEVCS